MANQYDISNKKPQNPAYLILYIQSYEREVLKAKKILGYKKRLHSSGEAAHI